MKKLFITSTTLYTVILFYLSLRPIPKELGDLFSYQDKFMHLGAYLLLGWLYQKIIPSKIRAISLAIFVGALLEVLQSFTSYRSFELLDIVANTSGVGLSYLLMKNKLFR